MPKRPQNFIKQAIATRSKSTGPKTLQGKATASANAITHGATSQKLLTHQESVRYENLVQDLKAHYRSSNPLIIMQTERIAKLTIQLERIQNVMDAQFQKKRVQSNIVENLINELSLGPKERSLIAKMFAGNKIDVDEIVVDSELEAGDQLTYLLSIKPELSQQDYLDHAPLLCKHLYLEAQKEEVSIEDYIDNHIPITATLVGEKKSSPTIRIIWGDAEKQYSLKSLEEEILKTDLRRLKSAANWFTDVNFRILQTQKKISDFIKLLDIEESSTMPNLEDFDKLMRYQTTLQRQLSTAMGELITLHDKGC